MSFPNKLLETRRSAVRQPVSISTDITCDRLPCDSGTGNRCSQMMKSLQALRSVLTAIWYGYGGAMDAIYCATNQFTSRARKQRERESLSQASLTAQDVLFVWVPKSGGTSLFRLLRTQGGQELLTVEDIKRYFKQHGMVTFGHFSIADLIEAELLDPCFLQRAWVFSVVRNPFERAVSLYEYLRRIKHWPPTIPFRIFCDVIAGEHYEKIGLYNRRPLNQLNPQVTWLKDSNGDFLDCEIFKLEAIELLRQSMLERNIVPRAKEVPRLNESRRQKPTVDYYDEITEKIIRHADHEDFERFGYSPELNDLVLNK